MKKVGWTCCLLLRLLPKTQVTCFRIADRDFPHLEWYLVVFRYLPADVVLIFSLTARPQIYDVALGVGFTYGIKGGRGLSTSSTVDICRAERYTVL